MTTLDALWMGLPVVALMGRTPSSRLAAAVLSSVGCESWIAGDEADYVKIAAALAADLPGLAQIRESLRPRLQDSNVGDPVRYTREVEKVYAGLRERSVA